MHNAQRKRAREKNLATTKRRRPASRRKISPSPTPELSPEPQSPEESKTNNFPEVEIEVGVIGVPTPVKRDASPVLQGVLIATAAKKAVFDSIISAAAPAAATPSPATELATAVFSDDETFGIDTPLTMEEIDTLMEDFISPLATQLSLSIVKEQEDEEMERQGQHSPETLSSEMLAPVVTMEPLLPAVVFDSAAAYNSSPFACRKPSDLTQLQQPASAAAASPIFTTAAGYELNSSCDLNNLQPCNKTSSGNVGAIKSTGFYIEDDSFDSELVAASFRLFLCHPAYLPLPILEHLKSLLKAAKN
jgi:hypothetical protein